MVVGQQGRTWGTNILIENAPTRTRGFLSTEEEPSCSHRENRKEEEGLELAAEMALPGDEAITVRIALGVSALAAELRGALRVVQLILHRRGLRPVLDDGILLCP